MRMLRFICIETWWYSAILNVWKRWTEAIPPAVLYHSTNHCYNQYNNYFIKVRNSIHKGPVNSEVIFQCKRWQSTKKILILDQWWSAIVSASSVSLPLYSLTLDFSISVICIELSINHFWSLRMKVLIRWTIRNQIKNSCRKWWTEFC